jgi:DNA-binding HxlR family transcriptional regulator
MLKRDYEGQVCSIARALEVIGDRWTLLIVRDVALGHRRFDELLDGLGIASNVLTDRLNRLVDEGVLERVRYSERPERFEYRLTEKGRELRVALLALMQWGDRYVSDKPPRIARSPCAWSPRTDRSSRPTISRWCPARDSGASKRLLPRPVAEWWTCGVDLRRRCESLCAAG